jgi:hypothetical protein
MYNLTVSVSFTQKKRVWNKRLLECVHLKYDTWQQNLT